MKVKDEDLFENDQDIGWKYFKENRGGIILYVHLFKFTGKKFFQVYFLFIFWGCWFELIGPSKSLQFFNFLEKKILHFKVGVLLLHSNLM